MIVIIIDGSEKRNCEGGFKNFGVRVFVKSAVMYSFCFAQTEACSWSKYELMSNSRQ